MEVKPLNSMGSLQPWLQVVRAVNPSASSQVTRKPCFEYDSVLLFENSSIDRVARKASRSGTSKATGPQSAEVSGLGTEMKVSTPKKRYP